MDPTSEAIAHANAVTPAPVPVTTEQLVGELEASGKVHFPPDSGESNTGDTELNEIRIISRRLKAMQAPARRRVLSYLQSRFGEGGE